MSPAPKFGNSCIVTPVSMVMREATLQDCAAGWPVRMLDQGSH